MQAKTRTEPYEYFEPVFDGSHEIPIDTEYNLPDYCADVQKILKCRVVPEVSSYIVGEDSITCDGICDIRIMYLDAKGEGIKCCDFTKEFSTTINTKSSEEKAIASIKANVSHMTCRAVSARRIDLHIAVNLEVYAVVQKHEMITTEIEDDTIEKRRETISASQAVNAVCHQFTIEEYIPLKNGKPPIENILRKEVKSRQLDCRLSDDRIDITGSLDVAFLYNSFVDGTAAEKMSATVDYNQSIDCQGIDDDCICDARIICGESSIQPKEDSMGECTGVSVFIRLFVIVQIYKNTEIDIIDDAYSVAKPVELNYSQTGFMQIQSKKADTLKNKCQMNTGGEEIQKIIDIWIEDADTKSYCDKGKLNHRTKYNICLLYFNAQGKIMYTEKQFDFTQSDDVEDERIKKCNSNSVSEIWEFRITDKSTVEVTVETNVVSILYSRFTTKQLKSALTDDSAPEVSSGSKFTIYYASEGESLWEIAKSHKALINDICTQNDIYEEKIQKSGPIMFHSR